MLLVRSLTGVVAAAALVAVLPIAANAQVVRRTACNDGSTTSSVGSNVCDGHGGINKGKTSVINRAPARHAETGHVTQAGTPTPSAQPRYEERRGWRWAHKDDKREAERKREEERRREETRRREEERRRAEKHDRVKCHDGRFESAKDKGKGVCKSHGGVAH